MVLIDYSFHLHSSIFNVGIIKSNMYTLNFVSNFGDLSELAIYQIAVLVCLLEPQTHPLVQPFQSPHGK